MSASAATSNISTSTASTGGFKKNLPLIIGIAGLVIAVLGMLVGMGGEHPTSRPGVSLLLGFSFWFAVLIGMLFLIQMWYLFDAGWSVIVRRQLEHMIGGFPLLAGIFLLVLFVPMLVSDNTGVMWKWLNPSQDYHGTPISEDALWLAKSEYLNASFFYIRVVLYFAILSGIAALLRKFSFRNDHQPNVANVSAARKMSALGIILTALVTTFAAFDFYMSLSYHWFSTMYGVWFFTVCMRTGLAATILLCNYLAFAGPLKGIYRQPHNYLLACLSLAFTVFWAYISFSQYFLIYNANIPEETFWYNLRELAPNGDKSQWWYVSLVLIFCNFFIPFLMLLFYKTKVVIKRLLFIQVWILVFCLLDLYFNIVPNKVHADNPYGYDIVPFLSGHIFFDLAAVVGVGGIVIWAGLRSMQKTEPIPIHDPRIQESIHYSE